jgi:hypothetical protein
MEHAAFAVRTPSMMPDVGPRADYGTRGEAKRSDLVTGRFS